MKKYTLPIMKKYLTEILHQVDPDSTLSLEGYDKEDCLELWSWLKDKYRIEKRWNKYVILPLTPEKKKHYEVLLEKFDIDPSSLDLREGISKKTTKENFFKVYDVAIAHLPKKDQVYLKKIKYYSERSTPRLHLDAFTRYNLSQESKDFILKLSEIFIA